jgi:hypothetical protein
MTQTAELVRLVLRNKLVGMWAAGKLGLAGEAASAYSDDLGMSALDTSRSDVLGRIRADFAASNVIQSDEEILEVMNKAWLDAGRQSSKLSKDASGAALVQIARHLQKG